MVDTDINFRAVWVMWSSRLQKFAVTFIPSLEQCHLSY